MSYVLTAIFVYMKKKGMPPCDKRHSFRSRPVCGKHTVRVSQFTFGNFPALPIIAEKPAFGQEKSDGKKGSRHNLPPQTFDRLKPFYTP
jgi:hypothetical protein